MERPGPLLLWEEGMRVCRSQVGPFVLTFRRLLSGLASTHANEHTSTKLQNIFTMYIAPPLLKEKLPRLPRPRVANHKSPIAGLTPPPPPIKWIVPPPPGVQPRKDGLGTPPPVLGFFYSYTLRRHPKTLNTNTAPSMHLLWGTLGPGLVMPNFGVFLETPFWARTFLGTPLPG